MLITDSTVAISPADTPVCAAVVGVSGDEALALVRIDIPTELGA